ncbi:tyrosine-type recombinase/integrase [Rhodococcus sp. B10]|uniref:tyrosine-type recombinase/integrase n=1 Tax=Rhodococcus sp. B10 TaxID=2695876 RepID=UPI0014312EC8|nr:tyrosine-type recombinase/integrase [Rhodococcus sp. B10]NIL77576.1 Tyrosine recombinase XerD [Rhodococcus sp. B10]
MTALHVTAMPASGEFSSIDREFYIEAFLHRWDSENTRIAYRNDIDVLSQWCTAHNLEMFAVHRIHLEMFMRHLAEERGNSANTIIHRIGTIRQFFDLAVDDGLMQKNPTTKLRLPKRPPTSAVHKALTPRDYERLAWAAAESKPTEYALILTMGMCGLRVTPACSLDVETSTVVDQAYRMFVFVTKGGETMSVPQPPAVVQAVDRIVDGRTTGPLFLRRDGSRMTRASAARIMTRLGKRAGIEQHITPHTLRHTFAVTSLENGEPLENVALSLGHKDSSTTYRHYGRRRIPNNQHTSHSVAASIRIPTLPPLRAAS